jgi:hypothetical protein
VADAVARLDEDDVIAFDDEIDARYLAIGANGAFV